MMPIDSPTELLHQYETGQGDYTRERARFLPPWTVEELIREANQLARPEPPR
jgi:hypothetical protein